MGKGKVPKADEQPEPDSEVAARIALQRNVETGLVMGVRADDGEVLAGMADGRKLCVVYPNP